MSFSISSDTRKIDDKAVRGLSGTSGSLAYKVHEIQKHIHHSEEWYGKDGGDSLLSRTSVTSWQLTAGTSQAFGSEVQLSDGTEVTSGSYMDIDKILVTLNDAAGAETNFKIQLWYGTSTFGAATLLTETVVSVYTAAEPAPQPVELSCPKIPVSSKIWARINCNVNSKKLNILIGLHTYSA